MAVGGEGRGGKRHGRVMRMSCHGIARGGVSDKGGG